MTAERACTLPLRSRIVRQRGEGKRSGNSHRITVARRFQQSASDRSGGHLARNNGFDLALELFPATGSRSPAASGRRYGASRSRRVVSPAPATASGRRAADIHRGAGDAVSRTPRRRRLVDQIAARQVDEVGMRLHPRQRRLPIRFSVCSGNGEADDKVGPDKQIVERYMLETLFADGRKGIGDQNSMPSTLAISAK